MNKEEKKKATIKWLQYLIDEINNNALSQSIPEEDTILNQKETDELYECIKFVKNIK